jgi:hypothetical protein
LRRPVAVFAAAAAAVPSVIGGWAWLLAPADTPPPPVVTDSPTTVTTTTLPPPDAMGRIATIVSEGDAELVGANPSLVVGADGLPMVMYTVGEEIGDSSRETVLLRPKLVRCLDTACSQSVSNEVAVPGFQNTLAIAPIGLPVFAHHDMDQVMLTRCRDASCTATSTVELAASSFIAGEPMAVAFDQRGSPIVAFINVNDYNIHVVACTSWSSGRVETFADSDNNRWSTNTVDLVVPGDGLPIVAAAQRDGAVHVAKCTDRACTESTATILDDTGNETLTADMALGSDDLPLVAYYADGDLRVA